MMYNNLIAYYERIFAFKQYHGWTITKIEELMPWELDVMTTFLNNYLQLKDAQRKQTAANL